MVSQSATKLPRNNTYKSNPFITIIGGATASLVQVFTRVTVAGGLGFFSIDFF